MNLFKPFNPQQAANHFDQYFQKIQAMEPDRPLQVSVVSHKLGLDYSYPSHSTNQPYHIASIGKVFTAVLVELLAERGKLFLKDPIYKYFSTNELDRLFVYQKVDYARQVTVEQLLGHTSGIADYFEGRTKNGKSLLDDVLSNPRFHWTPQKLVEFTRDQQAAVAIPGKGFNYSDTGYILLGLIIEKVTGKSFDKNLVDEFFRPLGMEDSYLMFFSDPAHTPKKDIEKIWFNKVEISQFESLSCDWSGGGIISTTADLLKFAQALRGGRLVQDTTLESMDRCVYRFQPGIYYGLGMMEIRFKDFFFLLGNLPKVKGHIGVLSTHMFYDPTRDAHIILNFGDNTRMVKSFRALIEIESTLQRM
jgi:D-alanyl-D-alanine carboxypeptidase